MPGTSLKIGIVELKISNLFNMVNAMLNSGKFSFFRNGLWAEAANTATLLEKNLLTPIGAFSPFHQFLERKEFFSFSCKNLVKCTTTHHNSSHQAKLANHVPPGIWLFLQKVIQLVSIMYSSTKQEKLVEQKTWLSWISHLLTGKKVEK